MGKRLYVGNLSYNTTQDVLKSEFSKLGSTVDVKVITDRETGRSRGFGFVEYTTDSEAAVAVQAMNGQELDGRTLTVKIAEERQPRPGGGGGGRSFGGGGGNRDFGGPPQDFGGGDKRGKRPKRGGSRRNGRDDWS